MIDVSEYMNNSPLKNEIVINGKKFYVDGEDAQQILDLLSDSEVSSYYIFTDNHVEIYFAEKPSEEIREELKSNRWSWNAKKKCWYARKNNKNFRFAKRICNLVREPIEEPIEEPSKPSPKTQCAITQNSLVVRSLGFWCNMNHEVEDIDGVIPVVRKNGDIARCRVPIGYCRTCGVYYLLEETYERLKICGTPLCRIVTKKDYVQYGKEYFDNWNQWRSVSPLRMWGYSVNDNDGLSDQQRRRILECIVDSRAMTKDRVLSYLDLFRKISSGRRENANQKWKSDRDYIARYRLGSNKQVYFEELDLS